MRMRTMSWPRSERSCPITGDSAPGVVDAAEARQSYGLRRGAEEFPLMVVLSIIYPCNFGCPNCPYTDANSEIRQFYHQRGGDLFPEPLWTRIAEECGEYAAWMRCT